MISLLVPTRKRAVEFWRMVASAKARAWHPDGFEVVAYQDGDDRYYTKHKAADVYVNTIIGPRILLSEMWNRCAEVARGDILMHCADDIVFRSDGWDALVTKAFAEHADRIVFVHGRDGNQDHRLGTHGFLHRNWVDALGYFVPPYFSSDYNDVWLTEVADTIGRRRFLPDIFTEHLHYSFGKGPLDATHRERLERGARDDVTGVYERLGAKRAADVSKLRTYIEGFHGSA